jgi:hypothetical protein
MDGVTGVIVDEFFDIVAPSIKTKLTLDQYYALPKADRTILRRAAFGATLPVGLTVPYDLAHLKSILELENERTGTFPTKWVDEEEADEIAYFTATTRT